MPDVALAPALAAALAALPAGVRLVLDPASDAGLDAELFRPGGSADDVTVVSGPEGGLTADERDRLVGFSSLGLGPRVLRADTAPVIAVALIRAATQS